MGCLGVGLAALLLLAVPASVARTSLIGAYVVIAVLTAAAVAGLMWNERRRLGISAEVVPRLSTGLFRLGVLTAGYVAVVTIIHATR